MLVARTHNVPAQPTTLGKRIAMFGEEIMFALKRLDHLIENYPCFWSDCQNPDFKIFPVIHGRRVNFLKSGLRFSR